MLSGCRVSNQLVCVQEVGLEFPRTDCENRSDRLCDTPQLLRVRGTFSFLAYLWWSLKPQNSALSPRRLDPCLCKSVESFTLQLSKLGLPHWPTTAICSCQLGPVLPAPPGIPLPKWTSWHWWMRKTMRSETSKCPPPNTLFLGWKSEVKEGLTITLELKEGHSLF